MSSAAAQLTPGPLSAREAPKRTSKTVGEDSFEILILAPLRNDAPLTAQFLQRAGLEAVVCRDLPELCWRVRRGCGAILIAEEAIEGRSIPLLIEALAEQPSWSEIPVAIITSGGESSQSRSRRLSALGPSGNVTLIERPFRPATLVSTFNAALKSRRRQYLVRELFEERSRMSREAEHHARIFDTALSAMTDFAYILNREGKFVYANKALLDFWGLRAEDAIGKSFFDLQYSNELATKLQQQLNKVFDTGRRLRDEAAYSSPTGGSGYFEYIFSPVFANDGTVEVVVGSTREMTMRRRREEALRDTDRRKDEFLAMLAHELRNPLAAVIGAANVLKKGPDSEDQAWAAGVIERQTGQLARLIDDLLDVSRITSGKIRLRPQLLDAATVLERACESVQPLCTARRQELVCRFERDCLWLEADATRLEQIVLNLLTNAAKYSPPQGRIKLTGAMSGSEIVICVQDNGMGMAPDRLPEMFELFAQGERSIARSEGGLGIGLTIVKALTEMHGGRVTAHSDGLDQGSTFTIFLPAAARPPVGGSPAFHHPAAAETHSRRIMVVDDNQDAAQGLARLLQKAGHELEIAYDGFAAIEKARRFSPHIVLLDIGLPGVDGYEVAARLRTEKCGADIMIIALSGYGQEDDRRRSKAAGFDYHLVKPINLDELKELLAQPRKHRPIDKSGDAQSGRGSA